MVDLTKSQGLNRYKKTTGVTSPTPTIKAPTFNPDIKTDIFTTPTTRTTKSSTPQTVSSKFKGVGGFALEQLPKVIGSIAQVSEDIGVSIGTGDVSYMKNTPAHLGGIITGTRKNSFVDIYRKQLIPLGVNPTVATAMGLYVDIFADPLNAIGGGLTKVGVLAAKVSMLNKAGRVIAADSNLAKQIAKLGLKAEDLILAGSKAEQAQLGQRALLKLSAFGMELPVIKGTSIYGKAKIIKESPIYGKANQVFKLDEVGKIIDKVFNTKTTDEGFNVVKNKFDNLYEYRKGKVMEEAISIQKEIAGLTQEEALKVVDVVESGKKTGNALLDGVAQRLTSNFTKLKDQEKNLGLLGSEIQDYFPHIKVKGDKSITDRLLDMFRSPKKYSTALGSSKERKIKGTVSEINDMFGTDFFQNKPAVAFAERALGSARAVTSKEFFDSVKQFAKTGDDAVEVAVKDLAGMKFAPDVAAGIDEYYKKIKPEELNMFLKMFDTVQNWWKAQALVSPAYHTRNEVGNVWNSFLDGSTKITDYKDSLRMQNGKMVNFIDATGKQWDTMSVIDEAQRNGVINEGWYASDIETAIGNGLDSTTWNPFKQNFQIFQWNKQVGSAIENNARLAHFIAKIKEGYTVESAAASVKKYLFDYQDLTWTEKNVFKRAIPFYTWTRKNIPLQIESLIKQPGKAAEIPKVINAVESKVEETNEKYLGNYIKSNIGVRYKKDDKGNTFYFLLGNWLPSAQAIDFLAGPLENTFQMLSPFMKSPIETWANQSSFFKNYYGNPQEIERYTLENQTFLGLTMRKKTVNILKNIRLLNEFDKLSRGSVWGLPDPQEIIGKGLKGIMGNGVTLPYVGPIAPMDKQTGRYTPETSFGNRLTETFLGKTQAYNPSQGAKFYQLDREAKINDLKRALTNAQKEGQKSYAKLLIKQIKDEMKKKP